MYCKIIMYHYIRPIKNSEYPEIKGLDLSGFKRQIKFFRSKFNFESADFLFSPSTLKKYSKISILLTFDDGIKDHFKHVYPILKAENIQGLFFPPAKPIVDGIVLDVHKIHFILACESNKSKIIDNISKSINNYKKDFRLENFKTYWNKLSVGNRFDSQEIIFIKNILQHGLPLKVRSAITNNLFKKYVSTDESEFSKKLYLSLDEIDEMRENGMFFGSHGYSHEWLSYMTESEMTEELDKSLIFLNRINPDKNKIMCYPYGDYNEFVINKIKSFGFIAGLTTNLGDTEIEPNNMFTLSRYDTNDFPQ